MGKMCATTPVKIIKIEKNIALTSDDRMVKINLIPNAKAGDYINIYADIALEIIPKQNARAQIKVLNNK